MLPFREWLDLGAMAMKGCSTFFIAPALLEPHHQITLFQRCSQCILQPQLSGQGSSGWLLANPMSDFRRHAYNVFTSLSAQARCDTGQFLNRVQQVWIHFFLFLKWLIKVKESKLPYYLSIGWGEIIGFIFFSRGLALSEMLTASSRNWT